jgi:hypothetical protein
MKILALTGIALVMSASAFSQTSVPAAPTLTAGAEFKGLRFDWDPVPGATWYQLEYQAHQAGSFVQQGDDFPATATATHFSFPLHLFDWTYARYRLAACNDAGCSRSAEVSVSDLRRDAVGYFKAAQPVANGHLGAQSDLSPDGYTLVAAAPGEVTRTSSGSTGGAVYVFRRSSGGSWAQRARLAANATSTATEVTLDVAVSASGNTVAVSQPSTVVDATSQTSGQVDVYTLTNGVYSRTRIPRPNVQTFGTTVALNDAGTVLAIGVKSQNQSVRIYQLVNGTWQDVRNLTLNPQGYPESCDNAVLSRDGLVIAEICHEGGSGSTRQLRDYIRKYSGNTWYTRADIPLDYPVSLDTMFGHRGLALDRTGDTIAVQFARMEPGPGGYVTAFIQMLHRQPWGYQDADQLYSGQWRNEANRETFGNSLALSGDGQTLAIGDPADNGTSWGPRAAPLVAGTAQTGAVYVYRRGAAWKLENMVKPNYNPNPVSIHGFGSHTALSQTGKTLVLGVPDENSSAKGIGGNWQSSALKGSGALFMY